MMRNILLFLVTSTLIACFSSCSNNSIYDSYYTIEDGEWHQDSLVVFKPHISNNDLAYDMDITIRNTNSYIYSNLWLFVKTISPKGKVFNDTLEVTMADLRGKWIGRGLGDTFELKYPFKENTLLPDTGNYCIQIIQGMRSDNGYIEGISDIGLKIELTDIESGKE
ncbi:gliding motility lipoprotein GldH [Halosquirtibacter laminarini]|uniref:Gliding motility lipoprotein GldH n=1 Tax=Halosquirtibacter laminarini TaxID=3374600 RepID=A0AC61NNR7_9BACT|nr:gliding motility lipoprotein GldH [Prolixibacteraceae bacterium]